jgi:hypothetical protein
MMVVDLLDVPVVATTATGPVTRYQRLPLEPEFSVSTSGTIRIPGLAADAEWRMVLEHGVPRFVGGPEVRLRALTDSVFEVVMGAHRLTFRVVPDDTPRLDWRIELDEVVRAVAPGAAGLDVLADVLLERQHPLGERLRGLPSQRFGEEAWLGDLLLGVQAGRLDLSWERGMVTRVISRGLEIAETIGLHVLTHLVQSIEVVAWEDASAAAARRCVDRLTAHSLPWLGSLTFHGLERSAGHELRRTWSGGRWREKVPKGGQLRVPQAGSLTVRTPSRVDPVPERGFMHVGEGSPLCFVRWRGAVVELTVARPEFSLNGQRRARPSERSPWLVALRPGDVFVVDERPYQLEADALDSRGVTSREGPP